MPDVRLDRIRRGLVRPRPRDLRILDLEGCTAPPEPTLGWPFGLGRDHQQLHRLRAFRDQEYVPTTMFISVD